MRFVVDLYRVIVLASLAVLLVGTGFLAILLGFGGYVLDSTLPLPALVGIVFAAVALLGILAVLIAIHDRLADIAGGTDPGIERGPAPDVEIR